MKKITDEQLFQQKSEGHVSCEKIGVDDVVNKFAQKAIDGILADINAFKIAIVDTSDDDKIPEYLGYIKTYRKALPIFEGMLRYPAKDGADNEGSL